MLKRINGLSGREVGFNDLMRSLQFPLRGVLKAHHGQRCRPAGYASLRYIMYAFLSVCFVLPVQAQQTTTPAPLGMLVDVGGYRVHVHCTGSGSPTIMIVGAAFSFDWDLVQSSISRRTRVCTFDPSGTTWSDPFALAVQALHPSDPPYPEPTCKDRVDEIHRVIIHAPVEAPYILVGFSIGALWERLYASIYPQGIAGMVIVDQAFLPDKTARGPQDDQRASSGSYRGPVLLLQAPLKLDFEDDINFGSLPEPDQKLHRWALAQHPLRPNYAIAEDCSSQIQRAVGNRPYPLGNIPVAVVRTPNASPGYGEMQARLLGLSRNSQQVMAWDSLHMVLIDEPGAVNTAIVAVIEAVSAYKLGNGH
jgi:pimeloyl-ACP methyl ester carboxylesterase